MDKYEIEVEAGKRGLTVHFQFNLAKNTGQYFEVGYVYDDGERRLFCKRPSHSTEDQFRLCNQYGEG